MSNTIINVEKSSILVTLLKQLIIALDPLSIHDTGVKKCARSFLMCLNNPNGCESEALLSELQTLASIIKSYDVKFTEGPAGSSFQAIPHIIYEAIQEVDHLMTIKQLASKDVKNASKFDYLLEEIEIFAKEAEKI